MKVLIALVFIFVSSAYAGQLDWHLPFCENCERKSDIEDTLPKHLLEVGEILKQGQAVEATIAMQFERWGDFSRWVNKEPTKKPAPKEFDERWKKLKEEAEAIIEVNRQLGISKRKLETVRTKWPTRILEFSDEVERLEKLRLALTSLAPWWISEQFKDLNEKAAEDDTFKVTDDALRKAFRASMAVYFNEASNIRSDINVMKTKIDESLKNKKSNLAFTSLIDNFTVHHGPTLDLLLQRSLTSGNQTLCQAAAQKNKIDKVKHYTYKTVEYGLTTVALLTGPEGMLAAVGVRSSLTYLARIGLATMRTPAIVAGIGVAGLRINDRINVGQECDKMLVSDRLGNPTEQSMLKWEDCIKRKETANLQVLISSISAITGPALPKVMQFLRRIDKSPEMSFNIHLINRPDNKVLSIMDLSEARALMAKSLDQSSVRYWEFVADVYKKRLNLSDEEIKAFIESSRAYESRTHLIMQTSGGGPVAGKIEGGVGLVQSSKPKDLLPLEKATGYMVPRNKGDVAEIVRLTATSDDSSKLMVELLNELSKVTMKNDKLKTLYVFTSRIHERLYKKLGIPYKVINKPNDRDVIMEIDAREFQLNIAKKFYQND